MEIPSLFSSRREFLSRTWNGLGAVALSGLLADELSAENSPINPLAPRAPHLPRRAKHCIFMFMAGGVSHMDTFDYKPELEKVHNKELPPGINLKGELEGRLQFPHRCLASPWKFAPHGESGRYISELMPHLSRHADDLAFVYGIKTDNQNHGPSTLHVTTGDQFPGSPSVGSWVSYGLGSPNQSMPGYVVIQHPLGAPCNGAAVWSNGYLPASYQGTLLRAQGTPILNLDRPAGLTRAQQRREFDALKFLNDQHRTPRGSATELEARIHAYELAFRMQTEAPEIVDISNEPTHIQNLYGLDNSTTAGFGRQCLLARRLVEKGVRYSLLVHGVQIGTHSWDDHVNVGERLPRHCAEVDQPVAALLTDLKQRGLLEETLVVWASEMGRTPFKNGELGDKPGREHNSWALCMWMAGGNVKGGATAGQTDEFGVRSIGKQIHMRDVHATILNLLGLDDESLTYLHAGRFRRLTDIGGHVLKQVLA
ncbi:MAG: DUF1501 domain-containing protein [Planctomycetes bacterium]|nr:DUF1501 domain-containing protein [Planctomycetota bacterium]